MKKNGPMFHQWKYRLQEKKMNPLKMIISPARTGRNILLTIGEMVIFNGPGFKKDKQPVTERS